MRKNALKQNKQAFVLILSSIMLFIAISLSISYAWITGAFDKATDGIKNPITYIAIGDTQGAITGTLDLNQTTIAKAVSFKNNSEFDVKIEEVLISITFYESEAKYNASEPDFDISLDYTKNGATANHVTPTLASGWSTIDNISYSTTLTTIQTGASKAFITAFALSDITADYNFAAGTFYEITIMLTTSPVV